jgi:GNAT superfamily N-acetyltransferase
MSDVTLRPASPADVPEVLRLVQALAEYEKLRHEAVATAQDMHVALFGPVPRAHVTLAQVGGDVVGMALWFFTFSTFTGRPGIWIEDVFVEPAQRQKGIGRALFRHVAARAVEDGCVRLEWSVLDWNEPAIRFYRAIGAVAKDDWTIQRVSGDALAALAT